MKKILLIIATALATAAAVSAQDMAQATETYNNGAMALQETTPRLLRISSQLSQWPRPAERKVRTS